MYQFPPMLMEDPSLGSTKTRCTEEKVPTEHIFIKVEPEPIEPGLFPDPLTLLALTKRLMLCTSCGNLRLTN
jgi:hypothetical protein